MLIFLTWSGARSKAVAAALHECLPLVCNSFRPWMSDNDIAKGTPWFPEITTKLGEARAGILCVTPENQDERWVLFEAGAVAKAMPDRQLAVPYLYGMKPSELKPPLRELQAVTDAEDRGENLKLVKSLFGALAKEERLIPEDQLERAFEMVWDGRLSAALGAVPKMPATAPAKKPVKTDEILMLVRELVERDRARAELERQREQGALLWSDWAKAHKRSSSDIWSQYTAAEVSPLFSLLFEAGKRIGAEQTATEANAKPDEAPRTSDGRDDTPDPKPDEG